MGNTTSREVVTICGNAIENLMPHHEKEAEEDLEDSSFASCEAGPSHVSQTDHPRKALNQRPLPSIEQNGAEDISELTPPVSPQSLTIDLLGGNLSRYPTEIISESSPPPSPSPELSLKELMWQQHRIKVRDFAYESTLPPVPVVKKKPPVPGMPRPLKDVSEMNDHQQAMWRQNVARAMHFRDNPNYSVPFAVDSKRAKLAHIESRRTKTPPSSEDDGNYLGPMRTMSYLNVLTDWKPSHPQGLPGYRSRPSSPRRRGSPARQQSAASHFLKPQASTESQSQEQGASQDSEYEFATPASSLNENYVLNTSELAQSQVESMISDSQNHTADISASQMGIESSQSQSQSQDSHSSYSARPLKRIRPHDWDPLPHHRPSPRRPASPAGSDASEVPTEPNSSPIRSQPIRVQPQRGPPLKDAFLEFGRNSYVGHIPVEALVAAKKTRNKNISPQKEGLYHRLTGSVQRMPCEYVENPSPPRYLLRSSRGGEESPRIHSAPATIPSSISGAAEESHGSLARRPRSSLGGRKCSPSTAVLPISPRRRVSVGSK